MDQTAFGYEQEDGTIRYVLTKAYSLDELFEFILERKIAHYNPVSYVSRSIDEYFSQMLFDKENSIWRVIYLLDNTSLCRHISKKGTLMYRN